MIDCSIQYEALPTTTTTLQYIVLSEDWVVGGSGDYEITDSNRGSKRRLEPGLPSRRLKSFEIQNTRGMEAQSDPFPG